MGYVILVWTVDGWDHRMFLDSEYHKIVCCLLLLLLSASTDVRSALIVISCYIFILNIKIIAIFQS